MFMLPILIVVVATTTGLTTPAAPESKCDVQSPFPCSVYFGVVYFTFDNRTTQQRPNDSLLLRATNLATKYTRNITASFRYDDEKVFRVWNIENLPKESEYNLSLVALSIHGGETFLWQNRESFRASEDLFHCYYNQQPPTYKPPRVSTTRVGSNTTTADVQWSINFWDLKYDLIEHHMVSATTRGHKAYRKNVTSNNCHGKKCIPPLFWRDTQRFFSANYIYF